MFTELTDNIRIMFIGPHRNRIAIIAFCYHEIYSAFDRDDNMILPSMQRPCLKPWFVTHSKRRVLCHVCGPRQWLQTLSNEMILTLLIIFHYVRLVIFFKYFQ